ncbi:MAG: hypothetical protein KDD36_10300 [Flavobacteriales bacterium]|nr:hypothetical protein [Flavobacteriales bacterium]
MIEKIIHKDRLLAIIISASYSAEGIEFFTPDDFSQQLAYMNRPKGYVIEPHVHNTVPREVHLTQEVLIVRKGRVRVDFYDNEKQYLESRVIEKGDVILLADGGHGFEMIEDAEMIEVKQGPYSGEMDKVRFVPVSKDEVKINHT